MGPKNGMFMTNAFWSMRSKHFPREYAEKMINAWALNRKDGFYGEFFPLAMAKRSMSKFTSPPDHDFGYTPDTAYFTLDGMFRQGFPKIASELTVNHLENYNYHEEWGVPVAPEAYRRDLTLFGDQYSNFNAGKILLFLEGLAGLSYSLPNQTLSVREAMPAAWDWMELEVPIDEKTGRTKIRIERQSKRGGLRKSILVQNCPLKVKLELWTEEKKVVSKDSPLSEIKATSPFIAFESSPQVPRLPYPFFSNDESIDPLPYPLLHLQHPVLCQRPPTERHLRSCRRPRMGGTRMLWEFIQRNAPPRQAGQARHPVHPRLCRSSRVLTLPGGPVDRTTPGPSGNSRLPPSQFLQRSSRKPLDPPQNSQAKRLRHRHGRQMAPDRLQISGRPVRSSPY